MSHIYLLTQHCITHSPVQSPHTSLLQKQGTHKYIICCHNTHTNGIFTILTRVTLARNYTCSLMMICNVLPKYVEAVKVF
jgi:hypothetical protein